VLLLDKNDDVGDDVVQLHNSSSSVDQDRTFRRSFRDGIGPPRLRMASVTELPRPYSVLRIRASVLAVICIRVESQEIFLIYIMCN